MFQLFLCKHIQHIALVFALIQALEQYHLPVTLFDPGIVPGNNIITSEYLCTFQQSAEFQAAVALDTGIRCPGIQVFIDEIIDHLFLKFFFVIKSIKRHTELKCHAPCVFRIVEGAAFTIFGIPCVKQLHCAADTVKTGVTGQFRGNTRIHAAAHRDQCFTHVRFHTYGRRQRLQTAPRRILCLFYRNSLSLRP